MGQRVETDQRLAELRQKAEEMIQKKSLALNHLSDQDVQFLLQELHVHQIELELQNQELREAQINLQLAHDRYLALYDFAPVGYFTIDQDSVIQSVNLTGAALLGIERKFLHHKALTQFIGQETQDIYYLHHKRLLETQQPQTCEVSLVKSDGALLYAHLESVPVQDKQGRGQHYWMAVTDITPRKEMELALQEREAFLQSIYNGLGISIFVVEPTSEGSFRTIDINPATERITGRTREMVRNKTLQELVPPLNAELFNIIQAHYRDCMISAQPVEFEFHVPMEGQESWWFTRLEPLLDQQGNVHRIIGTSLPITERKQAEQALWTAHVELEQRVAERTTALAQANADLQAEIAEREQVETALRRSNSFNQAVLDSLAAHIAVLDKTGDIIAVNQAWRNFAQENGDALLIHTGVGINYLDVCRRSARVNREAQEALAGIEAVLTGKQALFSMEYPCHAARQKRWFLMRVTPLVEDPHGVVVSHENVTERKEAEELLQKRNRELTLLSQSAQAFIFSLDLDETLATVLEAIRHLLRVAACRAWLVHPETRKLVCQQINARGGQPEWSGRSLALGEGLAGWVAQHGQSLLVPDIRVDVHRFQDIDPQYDSQIRSVLSVPLRIKHQVIGVLQALDTTVDRFTTADLSLLEPLAATAAMAVENARLYKQAQDDAETKATLIREINHRVKNNLAAIIGLLYTKQKSFLTQDPMVHQAVTKELITQVQGLATVHNLLSASQWTPIRLSELADQIIHFSLKALSSNRRILVHLAPSPVQVTSEQANHLALVINELVTNTVKHALPLMSRGLEIMVSISQIQDKIRFQFQDNGPGYPAEILQLNQDYTGIGFELIENIVRRNLRGDLSLENREGACLIIQFEDARAPEKRNKNE